MPRPQRITGTPYPLEKRLILKDRYKKEILESFGYSTDVIKKNKKALALENSIIGSIELCLGSYDDWVNITDDQPRSSSYIAEIKKFVSKSDALLQDFSDANYWIDKIFEENNIDTWEIKKAINKFRSDTNSLLSDLEDKNKTGPLSHTATDHLIHQLRKIFFKYYNIPDIDQSKLDLHDRKDGRFLSGKRQAEKAFIKKCLKLKKIAIPVRI